MHELQVTQSILDSVLAHARDNSVEKVLRIHLTIGGLHDFQCEWIQRYFDYLSEGSPAQGARIIVQRVDPAFHCSHCDLTFDVDLDSVDRVRCPRCSGGDVHLRRGDEFLITDMEVV